MPQKLFTDGFFQTMLKSGKPTCRVSLPELFHLNIQWETEGKAAKSSRMNLDIVISSNMTYNI